MSAPPQRVEVFTRRWLHDSHSLFDFEAADDAVASASFSMATAGILRKHGDEIEPAPADGKMLSSKNRPVLQWCPNGTNVEISPVKVSSSSSMPWIVVKGLPRGSSRVSQGDTIMMGRERLWVCEIVMDRSSVPPSIFGEATCTCLEVAATQRTQCRICLMEGSSDDDPFLAPCACTGSVGSVHLGCLRQWTKTRMNLPSDSAESYTFRKPCCEMCKSEFPAVIQIGNRSEPLVDVLPKVEAPFMVLQSVLKTSKSGGKEKKVAYHVVSFANNQLAKVGRGRECTIRLEDVSMSRWHASIRFLDGEFFIEDQQSKFGTLLAMRQSWTLSPDESISVKVGRTVLSLSLPQSTQSPISSGSDHPSLEVESSRTYFEL